MCTYPHISSGLADLLIRAQCEGGGRETYRRQGYGEALDRVLLTGRVNTQLLRLHTVALAMRRI